MNLEPEPTVVSAAASRASHTLDALYRAEATSLALMIVGLNAVEEALKPRGGQNDERSKRK